jgi:ABC-type multidrug transport system fused ATPase/permease subunit
MEDQGDSRMRSINIYIRLIRHVNHRWWLTGLAFVITFICLLLNLVQPYLISRFIDQVLIAKQTALLVPILSTSLLLSALSGILSVIGFSIFRYLEARNNLDLRSVILRHIRKIPLTEIEKHGAGKYISLMGMDTTTTAKFLNVIAVDLMRQLLQMIISLLIIFYMDWRLGVIAVVVIPIVIGIPRLYRKWIKNAVNKLRTHNEEIGSYLYESIQGSREIRAYGLEKWEAARNESMYRNLVRVSTKEGVFRQLSGQTGALVIAATTVLLYGFGSAEVNSGALTVGLMVASVQYLQAVLNPIQGMNYLLSDLLASEVAMSRIEDFLQSPIEAPAMVAESSVRGEDPHEKLPFVVCRNLFVSYEGTAILKGVNLHIAKGQLVAFVGRSGSGKSTLFKTLQGFMPIDEGEIVVNQIPFRQWSRQAISEHMSYVSQETFLFKGTLLENVALGKLGATEQEVYNALCEVDLKSYVDALPAGIHTYLDNQGFQLSGGQRQRVAIARAIIKNPELLILDEPTASLDRNTEKQVLSTINRIMKFKTTLISTHRLETIMSADLIYVMEQGMVLDFGTHHELMQRCSVYVNLVEDEEHSQQEEQVG